MRRVKTCLVLATLAANSCGCSSRNGVKGHTELTQSQRSVAKDATREELFEAYNLIARSTKTLNATVELKPTENLRPQHLLDALLWPEIRKEESVTLREYNEENARYYILTVLRGGYQVEVLREIWFDRVELQVSRMLTFGPKGVLLSDVRLGDWQPSDAATSSTAAALFPRAIRIERPHDDYKLDLRVTKVIMNEEIPAERFKLEQPAGAELVPVGKAPESK